MTVPVERTNAVIHTGKFLYDLLDPKKTPRVPKDVRAQARRLLRHYPCEYHMNTIAEREDGDSNILAGKIFGKSFI